MLPNKPRSEPVLRLNIEESKMANALNQRFSQRLRTPFREKLWGTAVIAMLNTRVAIRRHQISVQNNLPWCIRRLVGLTWGSFRLVDILRGRVDTDASIKLYLLRRSTILKDLWKKFKVNWYVTTTWQDDSTMTNIICAERDLNISAETEPTIGQRYTRK